MKDVKKQAPLKTAVEPKVKNGIKVLVIEDEKALVDALVYNLDREGYEVTVAHDGQDGLRKAQAIPDIILLDIMLPGINGIEILRELRGNEKTKSIPVIVVSAKSEETDQVVGFSMGADDYVTKPFSVKILLQRIKALQRRSEVSADESTVE
ncbi:DNA-binding response regulator, partial [bacterium]|nr:DNA-binding response regulator [bacterium]